jgi:flagellar motor protein MotB
MYEETFVTNSGEDIQEIERDFKLDPKNKTLTLIDKKSSVNQKPNVDKKSSNSKKSSTEKVKELETVFVKTHKNLEYLHYFDYNRNKINPNKADLKSFLKEIEQQLKDGREQVTINIYSSASQVPTNAFESNQKLSEIRAENLKYDIMNHFERKSKCKGKVNVVIVTTIVDGPEYVKDGSNRKKYLPYQFVGLKTE